MALELAKHNPVYEDIASKFFEVRNFEPFPSPADEITAFHIHCRCDDLQGG
jgi:hypothetical protein